MIVNNIPNAGSIDSWLGDVHRPSPDTSWVQSLVSPRRVIRVWYTLRTAALKVRLCGLQRGPSPNRIWNPHYCGDPSRTETLVQGGIPSCQPKSGWVGEDNPRLLAPSHWMGYDLLGLWGLCHIEPVRSSVLLGDLALVTRCP